MPGQGHTHTHTCIHTRPHTHMPGKVHHMVSACPEHTRAHRDRGIHDSAEAQKNVASSGRVCVCVCVCVRVSPGLYSKMIFSIFRFRISVSADFITRGSKPHTRTCAYTHTHTHTRTHTHTHTQSRTARSGTHVPCILSYTVPSHTQRPASVCLYLLLSAYIYLSIYLTMYLSIGLSVYSSRTFMSSTSSSFTTLSIRSVATVNSTVWDSV